VRRISVELYEDGHLHVGTSPGHDALGGQRHGSHLLLLLLLGADVTVYVIAAADVTVQYLDE